MGIKIVSQPIGSPIIAAASTAMAQANERTAERQSQMWQQQMQHKYRSAERNAEQLFKTAEDDFQFSRQQAMLPAPIGIKSDPWAAKEYAQLQDEERRIYSGIEIDPRSPAAQERLRRIAHDKELWRGAFPDPNPMEEFDKGRIFLDPSGSRIGPDGMPYTKMPEGGSELRRDPKTGAWSPPEADRAAEAAAKDAEKAKKEADAAELKRQQDILDERYDEDLARWEDERDAAKADRDAQIKAERDKENPDEEKIARIREDYRDKWSKKPRRPIARLPEASPATGPAPTGPVPTGPVPAETTPPVQPLQYPAVPDGAKVNRDGSLTGGVDTAPTFPPGADPYKTQDQNYMDLYRSYLNRGMSPREAVDAIYKHWRSTGSDSRENVPGSTGTLSPAGSDMPAEPATAQAPVAAPTETAPVSPVNAPPAVPQAVAPAGPPKPPTATPMEEGEPLPSDMSQVPSAYWPTSDRKVILEPDEKTRTWKRVTDPKRIKELNIRVYTEAYDKLLPAGKTYDQLTPDEKAQVRRIKEGYAEVSTW